MAIAIFGISNNGLNLVVNLFALMLVVLWLALIVYTYLDARRRISDPFLVGCATIASFIPYLGTAVYTIVRPPEFLDDAHERELEIKAAELRVRQLKELSCPRCSYPIEKSYMRCPRCKCRLKNPCPSCGKPVDPRWTLCPFCESSLGERGRGRERPVGDRQPSPGERREPAGEERTAGRREPSRRKGSAPPPKTAPSVDKESRSPKQTQTKRSASRESDPDPRQA